MIYAGDPGVRLPVKDLYDTQVMAMSIAAAKDMYEKGQKRLEDFYEKYGDFMSPILADMDWYEQNVTGRVRDVINNMYANGVDPLRSAEGRAAVSQLIYSMPTGKIGQLRQSAETAKKYLDSFDDDTNPELERFLGRDLQKWSTLGDGTPGSANGVWTVNRASKYQTIDDLIEPIVKNVDYTYDEDMTKQHNDGNNYYSITRDRLMQAVNDNMSDILATPSGAFHWDQAKKAAAAQGGGEELARQIFNNMIGNRLSDHIKTKFEADPFKLDDYRTKNDIRAHAANAATDYAYKLKAATDPRLNPDEYHRIFREAEKKATIVTKGKSGKKNVLIGKIGQHTQYTKSQQYSQWIDPMMQAGQISVKDKDTGETFTAYTISSSKLKNKGSIYVLSDDEKELKNSNISEPVQGKYTFLPEGNMRSMYIGDGRYAYFISGTFRSPSGDVVTNNNGDTTFWIQVKERDHNYGETQKKE